MTATLDWRDQRTGLRPDTEVISILAPSRGRPEALQEMADSANETASNIEILAYIDDDDPSDYRGDGYRIIRGPRITLSDCWNVLAREARGSIFGMGADDIRFRTPRWDNLFRRVFDDFPDRICFVHGRDGIHDEKLGTHGFISRRWFETVGYFTWPAFPADYADTWLHELADRIGRRVYVPDLLIEHLHPIAGKAEWDQTHFERLARGRASNVAQLWKDLEPQRIEDAEKLEAAKR
jgi:hypothetical protein